MNVEDDEGRHSRYINMRGYTKEEGKLLSLGSSWRLEQETIPYLSW